MASRLIVGAGASVTVSSRYGAREPWSTPVAEPPREAYSDVGTVDVEDLPGEHSFERRREGRYRLATPEFCTEFEVQHVRRERYQQHADVTVRCKLVGVQTYDGVLFTADLNLSNLRDREQFARTLASRTTTDAAAWAAIVSELSVRVAQAEDVGGGVVNLRDVATPSPERWYRVGRLLLPISHPSLFFGDGDSLKTYLVGHLLLELRRQGVRVGIADWEMTAPDHRERGERLSGGAPDVIYMPCARPLIHEADRIARAIEDHGIEYLMLDSAAPACNGRPEDAENASAYFRALRSFGIGSVTIAHSNRSEQSDQKPFGSVFWFNFSRAIWNVKRAESNTDGVTEIGVYPRKFNLGAPQRPTAFRFTFTDSRTAVQAVDITDVESLASKLPLKDRMAKTMRSGAKTVVELAAALGEEDPETISRTLRRYGGDGAKVKLFTRVLSNPDGVHRWALMERRTS